MNKIIFKIIILFAISLIGCNTPVDNTKVSDEFHSETAIIIHDQPSKTDSTKITTADSPNFHLLRGDWVRSDGGYMISIRSIGADGTIQVEYFNPNPIKVGKSKWESEDDSLYLQVELQDINYPGSTYTLQYLPEEDKLSGIYFQAVEGATYEVMFNRKR